MVVPFLYRTDASLKGRRLSLYTRKGPADPIADRPLTRCSGLEGLALRELRALASLLQAVLLALDRTGVTREEASLLEVGAILAGLEEGAGDAQAKSAGLAVDAAAIAVGEDVEATPWCQSRGRAQQALSTSC
jgi:hypothetical protein